MRRSKWYIPFLVVLVLIVASQDISFVRAQSRTLYGKVYSVSTGRPIAATVTASTCGYTQSASTGSDGSWQLVFPYGTVGKITISAAGYVAQTFQIDTNAQWFEAGGIVSLRAST